MPNFSQGSQTRVFFGIMPQESLLLYESTKIMVPPPNVVVTLSAAATIATAAQITAGFQPLAVTALTGPIAAGTPLVFRSGTLTFYVYLVGDAKTGDISLRVSPLEVAIPTAAVAQHRGIIQMVGGTAANGKIEVEDESVMVFTDKPLGLVSDELSGFMDGSAKSAKWSLDYESNCDPTDPTLGRLTYAGLNATNGVKAYVRKMNQPPVGYQTGDTLEGFVSVMGYEETNSADGIIKIKATLMGRGAPKRLRASLILPV